eukprot:g17430.t1
MVVALVQKCARAAKANGYDPPTNLGYLLDEFFDFYGNQLNYASTGITLLGEGGGGFYNKQQVGWFDERNPFRLSMQNPHETATDTASNSFKADVCMRSFRATSLRLKCAIQRDIRACSGSDDSGVGEAETGGFLKYCIDPGGELKDRVLPPPTFCTRTFDGEDGEALGSEPSVKEMLKDKAEKLMKKHGREKEKQKVHAHGGGGASTPASSSGEKKRGKKKGKGKGKGKEKEGDDLSPPSSPSASSSASAASSAPSCGGESGGGSSGETGKGKRKTPGSGAANGTPHRKGQGNAEKKRKTDK